MNCFLGGATDRRTLINDSLIPSCKRTLVRSIKGCCCYLYITYTDIRALTILPDSSPPQNMVGLHAVDPNLARKRTLATASTMAYKGFGAVCSLAFALLLMPMASYIAKIFSGFKRMTKRKTL